MSGRGRSAAGIVIAQDRDLKRAVLKWAQARRAEHSYARKLLQIARYVGNIIHTILDPADPQGSAPRIVRQLRRYSEAINDWAEAAGRLMVREVAARDWQAWQSVSREIGRRLRDELRDEPLAEVMEELIFAQAELITSLPLNAAEKVQERALEAILTGRRPEDLADEIRRVYGLTQERAMLIARTETGRAATAITRARAEAAGSTHFIWRTSLDIRVRPTHRLLEGKAFEWSDPPECDPGHHALPGSIWNCRCLAEPILPGL